MLFRTVKKIVAVIVLALVLGACGPYQKALKNSDVKPKVKLANKYYNEGKESGKKYKLKRSIRLLEQVLPQFRGKPQGERLAFIYAEDYYLLENYFDAAYQFERFVKAYPNSQKAEEATFKEGKSYYYVSPRFSLDQSETKEGMTKLQNYISNYPDGEHIGEANEIVASLRKKLEKKEFEIAKLYYDQDDYKAAIASTNNFVNENPGSPYLEKAYYYRMDAEHTLAVNSFRNVMEERLEKAKGYAADYLKYFPDGKYTKEAERITEDVEEYLKDFK